MKTETRGMNRSFIVIAVAILSAIASTGRAAGDFGLTGNQHLDVTSVYSSGILWDTSTADVMPGGSIYRAYVEDDASLRLRGGSIYALDAHDTSSVDISGGSINWYLDARDTSSVNISGGSINSILYAHGTSSVNISGSSVGSLDADDTSSVDISGGSIGGNLHAYDASSVDISGGSIDGSLPASGTSSVTFHGYDFRGAGDLSLEGETVLGTGVLTGKWFDDTPWAVNISNNPPTATIRAVVPEPSTFTLAAFGLLGLLAWGRRRRGAGRAMR